MERERGGPAPPPPSRPHLALGSSHARSPHLAEQCSAQTYSTALKHHPHGPAPPPRHASPRRPSAARVPPAHRLIALPLAHARPRRPPQHGPQASLGLPRLRLLLLRRPRLGRLAGRHAPGPRRRPRLLQHTRRRQAQAPHQARRRREGSVPCPPCPKSSLARSDLARSSRLPAHRRERHAVQEGLARCVALSSLSFSLRTAG